MRQPNGPAGKFWNQPHPTTKVVLQRHLMSDYLCFNKTTTDMVLETFLLFISTLISLNPVPETPDPQQNTQTEIHKQQDNTRNSNAVAGRGGWDRN